jgi:hypothetical protein
MARAHADNGDSASSSLHNMYQIYKAGTGIVINWLLKNGSPRTVSKTPTERERRLPVRKILELAHVAAEKEHLPLGEIRLTYKSVLFYR